RPGEEEPQPPPGGPQPPPGGPQPPPAQGGDPTSIVQRRGRQGEGSRGAVDNSSPGGSYGAARGESRTSPQGSGAAGSGGSGSGSAGSDSANSDAANSDAANSGAAGSSAVGSDARSRSAAAAESWSQGPDGSGSHGGAGPHDAPTSDASQGGSGSRPS